MTPHCAPASFTAAPPPLGTPSVTPGTVTRPTAAPPRPATPGYTRLHLTTGPRRPEAKRLHPAAGRTPLFGVPADPATTGQLPFEKQRPARERQLPVPAPTS
ncbi:hypothetical protein [Kitasatospora sp. NPDC093102]|uniref:hypothetical protein n=1 Tax=Kitasatospora sp. NPDC093102 TaxID=3155069 RepID=UPI0034370427